MLASTRGPLGLSAWTVLDAPPPDTVTAAAAAGFEAIGIRVFPAGDEPAWPMMGDTPMVRETRRRLADTGLTLWDIKVLRLREDKTLGEQLRILDAGHALGARFVLVNVNDPDESRRLDRLNLLAAEAAARALTLAVEYMIFTEIRPLQDAVSLVQRIEGPSVVLPDSLHTIRSGGTMADVAQVPPGLIAYAQSCDTHAEPRPASEADALLEARTGRLLPGDGDLPLVEFARALPDGIALTVEAPVRELPLLERCRVAHRKLAATLPVA